MKRITLILCLPFIVLLSSLIVSCSNSSQQSEAVTEETVVEEVAEVPYDVNSPETLLLAVAEACGGMNAIKALNDVEFEYTYVAPDGKKDVSIERYIFENEVSWAKYSTHEINVMPGAEGDVVQFYDGNSAAVYLGGEAVTDPEVVGVGQFLRQANYMWFNMMFKMTDPGIVATYQGQEEVDGQTYDKVHVTYDPEVTGKEENDIFVVYINPDSRMVESFYFSLPAFGVQEPVLHAQLTYEQVNGIYVITHRVMKGPNPETGEMGLIVDQQLKNVKFNNGFTADQLSQEM